VRLTRWARGLLAIAVAGCAVTANAEDPRLQPVKAGEVFGGEALRVRAPAGDGWLKRETATELWFAQPSASERETRVATVSFFELPEGLERKAFESFMRQAIESDTSPERFPDSTASYAFDDARGYACVRYQSTGTDPNAPGGALTLAAHGLYCRYTRRTGFGFAAVYSQRAEAIDPDLAQRAQAFLDGVSVPEN
jgi:hypothetical protein